jgi:predicted transcriptional regulator
MLDVMDITIEKQNILQWLKDLKDEKIIEKILDIKEETEISDFENQSIQKGLKDIEDGRFSSHNEVLERFKTKFETK